MSRVYISAAHKSSGKTTVTIGLCAALSARGYRVQPFKKGPDYIDPQWLAKASDQPCYNLDFNTMTHAEIDALWETHSIGADVSILEGNKGLYDGVDPEGSDCNAALAKQLGLPVILVVDVEGITRGVAPLLMGYQTFDTDITISGVILNKVVGDRHEAKLRAAIQKYTDLPVLGAIRRNADLVIDERHLGLVPSNEHQMAMQQIETIQRQIEQQVDIDAIIELLAIDKTSDKSSSIASELKTSNESTMASVRIGIAQDSAFGFYYRDDLEAFAENGAELVPIDLINDKTLPELDGLFIGGGFPEMHMLKLSEHKSMHKQIQSAVEDGLPVYAECGGLMYLCRQISWHDRNYEMAGALPADVVMHKRPQGRGYVRLKETGNSLWPIKDDRGEIAAHEFHHSSLENVAEDIQYAYEVKRGQGIDGKYDGMIYRNTLASYAHLRSVQSSPWVKGFVDFVKARKAQH